ncbi:hypothetical protein [Lacicoccus qingdaonensis]|uniref:hypothetical protein n=1 Tax=Lacicoccus qingdaonensis TaxID=576118 RepID=UPI001FDEB3C5|nr:hypothetical protein [Salinicoccus qingdaonensis]
MARAILLKVSPDFTVYEPPVEVFELEALDELEVFEELDVDELEELLLELLELDEPETFRL